MRLISGLGLLITMLAATAVWGEQYLDTERVRIHYNALSSNALTPEIAREYGIRRSAARGLVVITVQDTGKGFSPTTARVTGKMRNLVGQVRELEFRELKEAQAIYYIAEFGFAHMETLRFLLDVTPAKSESPARVEFVQQFWRDP